MAAAAAAAAATGPQAAMASTYMAKYSQDPDVLNGEYASLYGRYTGNATSESLKALAISASLIIPKVYLYMTTVNGKPTIAVFHRP